jgi:CIC family chloride channel protein
VLAGVIGALMVSAILGPQPAFALPDVRTASWLMYAVVPLVAVIAAGIGAAFQRLALSLRGRVRASRVPGWLRPLAGGAGTWVLGAAAFLLTGRIGVFGLGYPDLSAGLAGSIAWGTAGILVAAKFGATVASYGWEGSGGIFSPMLFLGGFTGLFLSGLAGLWIPLTASDRIILAAVGMSACFNAVVRAPLTGLLIVFEMTHQFALVPALMISVIISEAVARLAGRHNFYDSLLLQDGHELIKIKPPRDLAGWQSLPVSEIAKTRPVILADLAPAALREALESHPYERFPVSRSGKIEGVVSRQEIEAALAAGRPPRLLPVVFCRPGTTVRAVGDMLMASRSGMVLVQGNREGRVAAIVTLHDLLRAQAAVQE